MDLFSQAKPRVAPEKVRQIKTWIRDLLEIDLETPISIHQLHCAEPGCPPVETVIAVMRSPAQKYNIHKPIAEIEPIDISEAINRTKGKAMERYQIAQQWQETCPRHTLEQATQRFATVANASQQLARFHIEQQ
jgi:hypothetical protein